MYFKIPFLKKNSSGFRYNAKMKVAILGAGFSGLAAAYELSKSGHEVHLFEKGAQVGGAAGGFRQPGWKWHLDYAYHHCFTNEHEILKLAKKTGYPDFLVLKPETASLYTGGKQTSPINNDFYRYLFGPNTSIHKLDSPLDLLKFSRLPLLDRLRTGMVLALLKFGPKLGSYDHILAQRFLTQTMGEKANRVLWEPLFLKKFAGLYPKINLAFFWARLRRTPALSYPVGGYQAFANHLLKVLRKQKVRVHLNTEVTRIKLKKGQFVLQTKTEAPVFERLISTLQTPLFLKLGGAILPTDYRQKLSKIRYLGAQNIIIESNERILPTTYWLSIAAKNQGKVRYPGLDWMVAVAQTNFVNKKYYRNKHLLYLATYTNKPVDFVIASPTLAKKYKIIKQGFIKYGQPLYTPEFARVKPDYTTPVPGLYFANMELTYPKDRGTNQAVVCGLAVAKKIR
jgi:protoporphyrinogen oxidase